MGEERSIAPEGAAGTREAGAEDARRAAAVTPMMAQYLKIKDEYPDCLLFYRMGDFYELFFEDAAKAARTLDIALTKRGKHLGEDIPMCGVPVHSAESYLARLIRAGHRVAVCEQLEDPAEARRRGGRAVVERDVIRVITSGTITEDELLASRANNFLVAVAEAAGSLALSWLDISTGSFTAAPVERGLLGAELARLLPGEIIVSERLAGEPALFDLLADWKRVLTVLPSSAFSSVAAGRLLEEYFGVATLEGFGAFTRAELAAAGALLDYVKLTQKGRMPAVQPPRRLAGSDFLVIDGATRRNLELVETLAGERKGSLLGVIDLTVTGAGGRLIHQDLAAPLTDAAAINRRLDMVTFFREEEDVRERLRRHLGHVPDIERALQRLVLGRGGPRDLAAIGQGLGQIPDIREGLSAAKMLPQPAGIADEAAGLGFHQPLVDRLARALVPEPPPARREGGFIAPGYHPALDEERTLRDESRRLVAALEARYRASTEIQSLKVRHNNVLGYYVEVPSGHGERMMRLPLSETFIHRQTLASQVRFTTVELSELESRIARASDRALALEAELFEDLVTGIRARSPDIVRAAAALARLDVAASHAELAGRRDYARPEVDDSLSFVIEGGRHPVVEAVLSTGGGPPAAGDGAGEGDAFVPNDCDLGPEGRLWLVTGPNMAGKSTFLRQNALIAILAQIGAYVPAARAHTGVIDRLFSRVGAADDLARGRSTFMVEMVETAAILNQATARSLVILDEIGRGTATFDGLSIAWAAIEHLHDVNRARTLFATHYHELTELASRLDGLRTHRMRVKQWGEDIVFLHEVVPGAADRSYGIQVAKLAGLPAPVIRRAEEVLEALEAGEPGRDLARLAGDLPLFQATQNPEAAKTPSAVEALVAETDPDGLTPKAALELLYRLKSLLG